jgi:hypothetical protein
VHPLKQSTSKPSNNTVARSPQRHLRGVRTRRIDPASRLE